MIVNFVSLLASLFLVYNAPTTYSWSFCFACFAVYLIQTIIEIVRESKKKNLFSFNPIFLFVFFWVSYAYPLMIYGTDLEWFGVFSEHVNWNYLSLGSALCSVFISSYLLGYGKVKTKKLAQIAQKIELKRFKNTIKLTLIITFVLVVLNAYIGVASSGWHTVSISSNPFLFDFFNAALVLSLFSFTEANHHNKNLRIFLKSNQLPISLSLFTMLFFLILGDRGPVIRVALIIVTIYYLYYKKIRFSRILIMGFVGVAIMFFIRQTRETDRTSLIQNGLKTFQVSSDVFHLEDGFVYVFADLFGASHELTIACEYYNTNGAFHPERIVLVPFYPVPYLPTLVGSLLFGTDVNDFNTGFEMNRQMNQYNTHFGNHIVGDVYMSFGLIGVLFFSFILGIFVRRVIDKRYTTIYYRTCFVIVMSLSVYMARDSVFNIIRPISLALLFVYFVLQDKTKAVKSYAG